MKRFKLFILPVALLLLLAALATGTASAEPEGETFNHETCVNSVKFVYTASDNRRLDWAGYVDCSPAINYILMEAGSNPLPEGEGE